ncbi:MAG: GAF domain-containing protein [Proteobacteria bacterium]|nr:GAF domain-containing protein [Pseudomonadota bacterium]
MMGANLIMFRTRLKKMVNLNFFKKGGDEKPQTAQKAAVTTAVDEPEATFLDEVLETLSNRPELDVESLMELILAKARRASIAEAGSIFIVDPIMGGGERVLRCCSLQNDRIQMDRASFSIPIDKRSIAGYVAQTGEILEITDLYEIPVDRPYSFNRMFDDKHGYRSKSMLVFPLKNLRGQVTGVIQLLNHLEGADKVGSFKLAHINEMKSLVTMIGMLVERTALVKEVERLSHELANKEQQLQNVLNSQ